MPATLKQQSREILRRVRETAESFGYSPLLAEVRALRSRSRLAITLAPIKQSSLLGPDIDGVRQLGIRRGLPLPARRFLEYYQVARFFSRYRPTWDEAAQVCAVAGVLNLRDRISRGPEWEQEQLEAIGSLDPVWALSTLPRLDAIARELLYEAQGQSSAPTRCRAAETAYEIGREERLRGAHQDAEETLRAAVSIGRRAGDWETVALATLNLGLLEKARGRFGRARRMLERGRDIAMDHGHREAAGKALHELFTLAVDLEEVARADDLAGRALDAYGQGHPIVPRLVIDVTTWWLTLEAYERAIGLAESVIAHVTEPELQLAAWANLAEAAGGVGRRSAFLRASDEVERLASQAPGARTISAALVSCGAGALLLGELDSAMDYAARALHIAVARRDAIPRAQAAALAQRCTAPLSMPTRVAGGDAGDHRRRRLAAACVLSLQAEPALTHSGRQSPR
jgi:tetratricopeptide (TPR) repeat protein